MVLHLNQLQSPSPKDALCQVWLKLAKRFWRRNFFNFVNEFSLIHYYIDENNDDIDEQRTNFDQKLLEPSVQVS